MPEHEVVVLNARQQVAGSQEYIDRLNQSLQEQDLSVEGFERALQPALSFHVKLRQELAQLEHSV